MYKKREFNDDSFYHVTSRTNNKIRVFENKLGRRIMLIVLQDAKDKFRFRLTNFCIMPTHFHLLIKPGPGTDLSKIMHWIKINTAKRWNHIHGSIDHLWGYRFFARAVRSPQEYEYVMKYIDQNPVVTGLALIETDWKACGAYYKARNINSLVDFSPHESQSYIKLLSPIPPVVSKLLPSDQLAYILKYFGAYAEVIDKLYKLLPTIPYLGESAFLKNPPVCLHYFTDTADYFIYEYDGDNIMYGLVRFNESPAKAEYNKFNLQNLKNNRLIKLDLSWEGNAK